MADGSAGGEFSYQIEAEGASSFAAEGLPAGLTLNTVTGLISGTSSEQGEFWITITAENASGTGAPFSLPAASLDEEATAAEATPVHVDVLEDLVDALARQQLVALVVARARLLAAALRGLLDDPRRTPRRPAAQLARNR